MLSISQERLELYSFTEIIKSQQLNFITNIKNLIPEPQKNEEVLKRVLNLICDIQQENNPTLNTNQQLQQTAVAELQKGGGS